MKLNLTFNVFVQPCVELVYGHTTAWPDTFGPDWHVAQPGALNSLRKSPSPLSEAYQLLANGITLGRGCATISILLSQTLWSWRNLTPEQQEASDGNDQMLGQSIGAPQLCTFLNLPAQMTRIQNGMFAPTAIRKRRTNPFATESGSPCRRGQWRL